MSGFTGVMKSMFKGVGMSDFTGVMKSITYQPNTSQPKPKPEPELYDFEYESIIEHLSSKEHLLNELISEMLYLGDLPSIRNYNELPSLMDNKFVLREQVCIWSALDCGLTLSQKKLNEGLLSALNRLTSYGSSSDNTKSLEEFLHDNKNNKDLKVILNLKRGAYESTVLHAVARANIDEYRHPGNRAIDLLLDAGADPNTQNNRGKTPLYLAAAIGNYDNADSLLSKGANPSIPNKKGRTPQRVAMDKLHYNMSELFLTDKQKKLRDELVGLLVLNSDCTKNLKDFLGKHKGDPDLEEVLSIRQGEGVSMFLSKIEDLSWDKEHQDLIQQLRKIMLEAGVSYYDRNIIDRSEKKGQASKLLVNLTSNQKRKLNEFSGKVFQAQDMAELEEIVNDAVKSGVRLNYSSSQDFFSVGKYTFTDYVIKKISELEKNPKVASSIICQLVSKGAVFGNTVDANIINTLTSEFKEHKTNMKKAYKDYISNTHKFIEVAKSATSSELKDIRIDNSVFYLEYSKDSKIDITKITDGARGLGLTHGDLKCGRNIVKIGNSEVEIKTENGMRNYTDLTEGSNVVLTFYTSLGELEVKLCPHEENKNWIKVEVSKEGLLLLDKIESYNEAIEDCNEGIENYEEIGQNCLLGGLSVIEAIDRGVFARFGGLMRPEVISESNKQKGSWVKREDSRRVSDSRGEVSR